MKHLFENWRGYLNEQQYSWPDPELGGYVKLEKWTKGFTLRAHISRKKKVSSKMFVIFPMLEPYFKEEMLPKFEEWGSGITSEKAEKMMCVSFSGGVNHEYKRKGVATDMYAAAIYHGLENNKELLAHHGFCAPQATRAEPIKNLYIKLIELGLLDSPMYEIGRDPFQSYPAGVSEKLPLFPLGRKDKIIKYLENRGIELK